MGLTDDLNRSEPSAPSLGVRVLDHEGRVARCELTAPVAPGRPCLHDRVLVKRVEAEEKTKGGIIIPDTAQEKPQS